MVGEAPGPNQHVAAMLVGMPKQLSDATRIQSRVQQKQYMRGARGASVQNRKR